MDAVKKLNEKFLSCSICTDRFTDPCTLGCGHTFCRGCLANFSKTHQEAIKAKSVPCPICRQMTKVPAPNKPAEEWPKQFKPHFLIQGLLDEFEASGDCAQDVKATAGRLCFPCQQMGKTIKAGSLCQDCDVTLCKDCVRMHQTIPGTKHHDIIDEHGEVNVKGRRRVICKEHNSVIEFCCKDCNKIICPKCCILHHRSCASVVAVDSMVTELKSTLKENSAKIAVAMEHLQTNLALQHSVIDAIKQNKVSVTLVISSISQQAIDLIKQKEKKLMDELDELTEKQTGQLRGLIKTGEIDLQMYQQYSEFIDQALRSESQVDLYDVYLMCQSGAVKCAMDKEADVSSRTLTDRITLVDKLVLQPFSEGFDIGRLQVSHDEFDLTGPPALKETIDVRTEGEDRTPSPADVLVSEVDGNDTIVVTDYKHGCLKSFFVRGGQTHSDTLMLSQGPDTVTKLQDNQVAVSFLSCRAFVIVNVTPHLVLQSEIATRKEYRCLTALSPGTLAAGCVETPSIDILDLSGNVLRSLTKFNTGHNLLQRPWVVYTTNKGHILVSDPRSNSVYCLTQEGDVVFTYCPEGDRALSGPRGVTTTPSGDVLVVDSDDSKVIQLTKRGVFVKDILTRKNGLERPRGICLHRDRLYITEWIQGSVKVFH